MASLASYPLAEQSVAAMLRDDAYSAWLGIDVEELEQGRAVVSMVVRPEMLNGFGICHGGVTFALADSALAFAANAYGDVSVTVESSIAFTDPARTGDRLVAVASELHRGRRIGHYQVHIFKMAVDGELVGSLRGVVYRTDKPVVVVAGSDS